MNMFDGFTDGAEISQDDLNTGRLENSFNFEPATNAVLRLIDIETRNINPEFGGIEYTLEMIRNDEGVNVGEQKRHLFATIQSNDEKGQKKAKIENSYFKASVAAMGFQGQLTDKSQLIGKVFMADITIFKAQSGKEYQNMKNFRPVETAGVAQRPAQTAQQQAHSQPAQPQGGFGQQGQGGGFGQQSQGFGGGFGRQ